MHAGRYGQQAGGTHPTGMHSYFILVYHQNLPCVDMFSVLLSIKNDLFTLVSKVWSNLFNISGYSEFLGTLLRLSVKFPTAVTSLLEYLQINYRL